ncbi:MAG: tRNA 2-thiouridine(34) synthase MnmA [Alphaproteobacteria bacterium]|nr:tRNA 2-thiouridine(34) synthase MnmA [Alphaproteobacteria bacterium]
MKCVVGLSGGVDSSTSAFLMKQRGYEVIGCTLRLFNNEKADISVRDATAVADFLKIPIEVLDCSEDFNKYVIDYFVDYYKNGKTPSPCVMCNEFIKFKYLNEFRMIKNADILVTGHYANIKKSNGRAELYQGADRNRDQSYFLYAVDGNILANAEFPLGGYSKSETRAIARKNGIQVAEKPDSQDICFIQNNNYIAFIKEKLNGIFSFESGDIVDINGKVLGQHNGIINYTIGQRRGLGLSGGPFFVYKIDAERNEIVVSDKEGIKVKRIFLNDTKFINEPFEGECRVKIRSNGEKIKARLIHDNLNNNDNLVVDFLESEYGAAQGQHCVFFDEKKILGGGEIK